ncbi:MAG: alpha/beta fold hydrolase [Bdellovibrionales bacterium]
MEIKKETGFVKSFDGTPIYYESRGEGEETLVFIYGIACLMNHWHYQVDHFAKKYRVITYDLRGHHKSGPLDRFDNLTMETLAHDLLTLLEKTNAKKVTALGHSFGAPVLLAAHEQNSNAFDRFVFINGFQKNPIKNMFGLNVVEPFFYFVKNQFQKSPLFWNSLWKTLVDNPIAMNAAAIAGGFNLRLTEFKDIEIYVRGVGQLDLEVFIPLFEQLMAFDGSSILPTIQQPTLIVAGQNDNITPKSFQYEFKEKLPHAEYIEVPYGSHCTQLDFPDFINLKIESFLSARPISAEL